MGEPGPEHSGAGFLVVLPMLESGGSSLLGEVPFIAVGAKALTPPLRPAAVQVRWAQPSPSGVCILSSVNMHACFLVQCSAALRVLLKVRAHFSSGFSERPISPVIWSLVPAAASAHSVLCISPSFSFRRVHDCFFVLFCFLTLSSSSFSVLVWTCLTSKYRSCFFLCHCMVC